jgi:hypothetical protein
LQGCKIGAIRVHQNNANHGKEDRQMNLTITAPELIELIKGFENYKLGPMLGKVSVDIYERTHVRHGASIRDVHNDGFEVFFYDRCELVKWDKVQSVVVHSVENGAFTSETVYNLAADRIAA